MNRLRMRIRNAARILVPALAFLVLPPTSAHAQWGYGGYYGYGYGYPYGYGYSYAYPGYAGVAFPGYAGVTFPNYYGGIPGYGYGYGGPGGFGLGYGYAYPPYNYGFYGNAYPGVLPPLGTAAGYTNPLFGMGLSPLGVQSGLSDAYLRAATRRPATTIITTPTLPPTTTPTNPPDPAKQSNGTGSARPR